jgi:PAS domain S-box-containing protein
VIKLFLIFIGTSFDTLQQETFTGLDFRLIVEAAPNEVIIADEDGRIVYANQRAGHSLQYPLNELLGKSVDVLIPQRHMRSGTGFIPSFLEKPSAWGAQPFQELTIVRRDGTEFPAEVGLIAFEHNDRQFVRMSVSDLTERRRAQAKLIASETRFRQTLDSMLEGAQIIDFEYRYVYLNDAIEKQARFRKHELIGYTMMEKYPGIEKTEVFASIKACMENREHTSCINEFTFPDGTKGWFELYIQPVTEGVFILSEDITARKRHELALLNLNEDLERKVNERTTELERNMEQLDLLNKELEAFSYSVSHDLRAPLRAISGYAQMLNEDYDSKLDDEARRLLGNIRYNAAKMGTLIDDLLAFSRLGRKETQKTSINLADLVESALHEIGKSTQHKAAVKWSDLHTVEADYGLLYQVVLNLLSNAIKYSSKKDKPEIVISSEQQDHEIIFSIQDNGAGFNMKYADKLFGVFQRLHANEEFEGTGVGLAIVQRIIAKHHGRTWAEGTPGKGATFYFSLPINTPS